MSSEKNLEGKIFSTQCKMKEIAIQLERLNREYHHMLEELAMTPEELKEYTENPENFSPPIWEELQKEKKRLDEKLNLELTRVRDPLKTKKSLSERGNVQQHWLFVR